jgi:hypothetical protein
MMHGQTNIILTEIFPVTSKHRLLIECGCFAMIFHGEIWYFRFVFDVSPTEFVSVSKQFPGQESAFSWSRNFRYRFLMNPPLISYLSQLSLNCDPRFYCLKNVFTILPFAPTPNFCPTLRCSIQSAARYSCSSCELHVSLISFSFVWSFLQF